MADSVTIGTVIAGFVGGASGGFLSTLMQISSERDKEFRTRRLTAADEFSTALTQALLELNDAHAFMLKGSIQDVDVHELLGTARESIDKAHTYLSRVELLFYDESEAGAAANSAIERIREARGILSNASSKDGLDGYAIAYDRANECHLQFNRAVLARVQPSWHRRKR
jgi:hypothetical protein